MPQKSYCGSDYARVSRNVADAIVTISLARTLTPLVGVHIDPLVLRYISVWRRRVENEVHVDVDTIFVVGRPRAGWERDQWLFAGCRRE